MSADTVHLFWIFFWLILLNAFIFVLWTVLALSSRISRDEEAAELEREREWWK